MSFFYRLGRKAAPHLLRAKWWYTALAGDEDERLKAEFNIGMLLAQQNLEELTVYPEATSVPVVMARLADRLVNKNWTVTCTVTDSSHQHAFALPGGFVFISYTLAQMCRNDDELAFVLGHELAHVVKGHAMQRLAASSTAGIFQKSAARRTPVIQLLGPFIGNLLEKGYQEDQEFDADAYAVRLMKSARFDSRAGVTLLKRLHEVERDLPIISPYFAAHPPLEDRIQALQQT